MSNLEKTEKALRGLMLEVSALLSLAEPEVRAAVGHTNTACLKLRLEEAKEALTPQNETVA